MMAPPGQGCPPRRSFFVRLLEGLIRPCWKKGIYTLVMTSLLSLLLTSMHFSCLLVAGAAALGATNALVIRATEDFDLTWSVVNTVESGR